MLPLATVVDGDDRRAGPRLRAGASRGSRWARPPTWRSGISAAEWTVRADTFHSRSANNAFLGRRLRGRCQLTLAGGQVAFRLVDVGVPA